MKIISAAMGDFPAIKSAVTSEKCRGLPPLNDLTADQQPSRELTC